MSAIAEADDRGEPSCAKLDRQTLAVVLSLLDPPDVARARAVCRTWRGTFDAEKVCEAAFLRYWDLTHVLRAPKECSAYLGATLACFVRKHRCSRTDTLSGLALRHGTSVLTLRVANNLPLAADHVLRTRDHVFIPVSSREEVAGKAAVFGYCRLACRPLVVVAATAEEVAHALDDAPPPLRASVQADLLAQKLTKLLSRGLRVDEGCAQYYLQDAGGDLKSAIRRFEEDARWEAQGLAPAVPARHITTARQYAYVMSQLDTLGL